MHNEEKKAVSQLAVHSLTPIKQLSVSQHHLEQERLKLELSRSQRTVAEQNDRNDKLKKQNETLDARVQELKKTSAAEQAELRDLRLKLRASEHERTQLATKQGDAAEARKAEARRRDEIRERDRKIAELEKALGAEKKKREALEARLQEAKAKTDERVQESKAEAEASKEQLQAARKEAETMRSELRRLEDNAGSAEDELLEQLEHHRYALTRVAQEYGRLASTTISRSLYQQAKQEAVVLQLRNTRLERKLANSDGQVVELANLIRQMKEEKAFLTTQLRETQEEADSVRLALHDTLLTAVPLRDDLVNLEVATCAVLEERRLSDREAYEVEQANFETWAILDRAQKDLLLFNASVLAKEVKVAHTRLDEHAHQLAEANSVRNHLAASLERAQTEHAEVQRVLAESTASLAEANVRAESLKNELDRVQADARLEVARAEQGVQQEKKAAERLSAALHQAQQTEQFLQSEVEQYVLSLPLSPFHFFENGGLI